MKTRTTLLATCGLLASLVSAAQAFTYESATELFLNADLDGDGRDDIVIVDRATGAYRLGFQTVKDVFTWADARPSGITNVAAVAAGKMLSLTQDALAFASMDANRVNVFGAPSPTASTQPVVVYPKGLDLSVLVSLNAGIAPVTPYDDLVCGTTNGVGTLNHASLFVSSGAGFAFVVENTSFDGWKYGKRVQLKAGGKNYVGATVAAGTNDGFRVYGFDSGAGNLVVGGDGVPSGSRFVTGSFSGGTFFQYVFFAPGGSNLVVLSSKEVFPGLFGLTTPISYPLGVAIDQLYTVNEATAPVLLAILSDGSEARTYSFDGVNPPVLQKAFHPASGQSFTGVVPFGGSGFQLFSGPRNSGRSSQFQQYTSKGSAYAQVASGNLPGINSLGINANVFLFAQEPFVSATPGLIQTLNAADWSSSPTLSGGVIKVNAEHFADATNGLDNPTARSLGTAPATANYALVNQYSPGISVASFQPALGAELTKVSIAPPPGPQAKAVMVSLVTSASSYAPMYSLNGGPWTLYSTQFWIFKTTSVRYFAQHMPDGTSKTPSHTALYTYTGNPSKADSDGDGVPDFVELGKGLDPTKGPDSDGDGFTDLSELLAHTDPNSKTNYPAADQHADEFASFDLKVAPRPYDATTAAEVSPQLNVDVHVHELNGSLLQTAVTQPAPGETFDVNVRFTNILAGSFPSLLAVGTAANFEIETASTNTQQGRELIGIVPAPGVQKPVVDYRMGDSPLAIEAKQWTAVAVAAYAAAKHPVVTTPMGVDETLAALLLERKVNQLLVSRGVEGFDATNLTLFGFRRGDSSRLAPSLGQLTALSFEVDAAHPGYDLEMMHSNILMVVTGDVALAPLRQVAFDVYRTSSLSNNASPGLYPLPVDVLRAFLVDGTLHAAYLAASPLPDGTRLAASTAAAKLLASLGGRPIATFNLDVTSNSFETTIPKLLQMVSGTYMNLFTAVGVGYKFPDTFSLIPGARLQVTAYTDFVDPDTTGVSLQVISASLISAPAAAVVDNNHNLISDAWEELFLGGATDSSADSDGDGYSDIQESLDGTDPTDPTSHGLTPVKLSPPTLSIVLPVDASLGPKIGFSFPAAYAARFKFTLESAPDLGSAFSTLPTAPVAAPGEQLEIQVPIPGTDMSFYRLRMELP